MRRHPGASAQAADAVQGGDGHDPAAGRHLRRGRLRDAAAVNPLYFLIAATYGLTLAYALACASLPRRRPWSTCRWSLRPAGHHRARLPDGRRRHRAGLHAALSDLGALGQRAAAPRARAPPGRGWPPLLYAGMIWARARRAGSRRRGSSDIPALPAAAPRSTRSSSPASPARRSRSSARTWPRACAASGERLEEAAEQVADLRELNQVVVEQHPQRPAHRRPGRARPLPERVRAEHPGPQRRGRARPRACARCSARSCWSRPSLQARAAHRGLARLDLAYQRPDGSDAWTSGSRSRRSPPPSRRAAGYLLVFQDLTDDQAPGARRAAARRSWRRWARWRRSSRTRSATRSARSAARRRC